MSEIESEIDVIARMLGDDSPTPNPYHGQIQAIIQRTHEIHEFVNRIGAGWKSSFLDTATTPSSERNDFDDYAKPITTLADVIRRIYGFRDLAMIVTDKAIELTVTRNAGEAKLHLGALYAMKAILHFEKKEHQLGLSALLAAAKQDCDFGRITHPEDSYAMSNEGLFGQWVRLAIYPLVRSEGLEFSERVLQLTLGHSELMVFLSSLSAKGDVYFLSGVLNPLRVDGNDCIANSIRYSSLRDLATLFETMLRDFGQRHLVPNVANSFINDSPALAAILRANPGIFANQIIPASDIRNAICTEIASGRYSLNYDIASVWTHLNSSSFLTDTDSDQVVKRILFAYRLRNETSHSFTPEHPIFVSHFPEFRKWILEAIFYVYFFFKETSQLQA